MPLRGFLVPADPSRGVPLVLRPADRRAEGARGAGAGAAAASDPAAAAVVGLETLTDLPREHYQAVFWSGTDGRSLSALDEFLGPW